MVALDERPYNNVYIDSNFLLFTEAIKNEYREMIDSVKAAWSLVGHKLKNHGNSIAV